MSCGGACRCGGRCAGRGVARLAGLAPSGRGHRAFVAVHRPLAGVGGAVGRWGPVVTYGGRTEGEPCLGVGEMCTDLDVGAWHYSAKVWQEKARWVREMLVLGAGERDAGGWSAGALAADAALEAAAEKLGGDLGYTDSAKVEQLVKLQRVFMWVAEQMAVAVDATGLTKIDGKPYQDQANDPENTPPVIPWPGLPGIFDLLGGVLPLAIGGGLVLLLVMRGNR